MRRSTTATTITTLLGTLLTLAGAGSAFGTVTPAGIFADSMVLQRNLRVPVWGWAAVGEVVTVTFNGQTATATARDSTNTAFKGYWKAWLNPMTAGGPFDMTISGSQSTAVTLHGLLVGDVWLCSGQSNMWYTFNGMYYNSSSPEVQALPPDGQPITQIRMCTIGGSRSTAPVLDIHQNPAWSNVDDEVTAPWRSCSRTAAMDFSACGGVFGVTIYAKIQVPVGLIAAAVGGTALKFWEPEDLSDSIWYRQCNNYPDSSIPVLVPIRYTGNQTNEQPGGCYNGLINPLVGFGIKGVIWWQGEEESVGGHPVCWYTSGGFRELIRGWRGRWGQGNFPFLYVQMQQGIDGQAKAAINDVRDMQQQTLSEPNTGMSICFDSADAMHPGKYMPAMRLALATLATVYGQSGEYMGPIYTGMAIEGSTIRVSFAHVGAGLVKHDLCWFEGDNSLAVGANVISSSADTNAPFWIAGSDNVYHAADATISGTTVVVSSPAVGAPKNVHYAIEIPDRAKTPLYNSVGLPASMFRTDTWAGLGSTTVARPRIDPAGRSNGGSSIALVRVFSGVQGATRDLAVRGGSVDLFDIRGVRLDSRVRGTHAVVLRQRF